MKNMTPKPNRVVQQFLLLILISLMSCGGASNQTANAEGFSSIQNELNDKFGENAYYTDLTISYDSSIGNIISVTVTEAPESLTMGQWNLTRDIWKQNSDISLEVPEGTNASDFMFQLNDQINLTKLGELTEKAMIQLTTEKDIKNPMLKMAFVKFPKNGNLEKTEYYVMLEPEHGGTTFTFRYTLQGELIKMDY